MDNHRKLKQICDEINHGEHKQALGGTYYFYVDGFKYNEDLKEFQKIEGREYRKANVREIIYTQSFMDKYIYQLSFGKQVPAKVWMKSVFSDLLLHNLDEPVEYLHGLLFKEGTK